MDANYYTTYLRAYLTNAGDVREYEVQRRAGAPPACAQELAMTVLMEGLE